MTIISPMRFVAIFDDSTEMAEVRNRLEPDHLRYLEVHHLLRVALRATISE